MPTRTPHSIYYIDITSEMSASRPGLVTELLSEGRNPTERKATVRVDPEQREWSRVSTPRGPSGRYLITVNKHALDTAIHSSHYRISHNGTGFVLHDPHHLG